MRAQCCGYLGLGVGRVIPVGPAWERKGLKLHKDILRSGVNLARAAAVPYELSNDNAAQGP